MVEKTLTVLITRAALVPWLTATLFIDETDSVAPNRNDSNTSETKARGASG